MAKDFEIRSDISSDTGSEVGNNTKSDFGGDLAKDDGVDLNKSDTKYAPNDGFTDEIDGKGPPNRTLPAGEGLSIYGKPAPQGDEYEGNTAEFVENDTPYSFYDNVGNRTEVPADADAPVFVQELGNYAAPADAPFEGRGLKGDGSDRIRYEFETQNPIDVKEGFARPWDDDDGGGIQYQTGKDWGKGDEVNFGQRIGDSFDPESKENSDIWPTSVSFEVDNREQEQPETDAELSETETEQPEEETEQPEEETEQPEEEPKQPEEEPEQPVEEPEQPEEESEQPEEEPELPEEEPEQPEEEPEQPDEESEQPEEETEQPEEEPEQPEEEPSAEQPFEEEQPSDLDDSNNANLDDGNDIDMDDGGNADMDAIGDTDMGDSGNADMGDSGSSDIGDSGGGDSGGGDGDSGGE